MQEGLEKHHHIVIDIFGQGWRVNVDGNVHTSGLTLEFWEKSSIAYEIKDLSELRQ